MLRAGVAVLQARPRWLAPILGALAACGFEPLGWWPLTLLAIAGLIALIGASPSGRQAALLGWLFGLGHFTLGNSWIATAFTYQAAMPTWLGWVGVIGLAAYLAVYPMLAALGGWWLARRGYSGRAGAGLVMTFAGCWIISEWLRSWVFTGFAWNPLGMVALGPFDRPGLAGLARVLGTYGLSGMVALLGGLWFMAARRRDGWALVLAILPVCLLLLMPASWDKAATRQAFTLVQPDVRQEVLNDPAHYQNQFIKTARLSKPLRAGQRRLVLWPESGVQDYLRGGYPQWYYEGTTHAGDPAMARQRLGSAIGPGGMLLTGAIDMQVHQGEAIGARNVVTVLDDQGTIRGSYAKAHLVPYGEYLPMRPLLEPLGLSRLVPGSLDFLPGPGPRTLDLGAWGTVGVQLCYEIVFSGQVTDRAHRPDFLFNPTNDGWFGAWGPPQHLAQARMRAIEEGLPVLRATTTGISAVILPSGVVKQFIPRHQAGRIDGAIPAAHAPTLFSQQGNRLPLAWAGLLILLSLVAMRLRRD